MLYPQKGSIAKGSRRSLPTAPVAAAVVSEERIEPKNTPWSQLFDWEMSGITLARRPPKRIASIGTPVGSSHSAAIAGSWDAGAVKREFGCAAGVPRSVDHSCPFQSIRPSGGSPMPSHQMSPSGVIAVLVKMVLASHESMALGFVCMLVPGATPKKPA